MKRHEEGRKEEKKEKDREGEMTSSANWYHSIVKREKRVSNVRGRGGGGGRVRGKRKGCERDHT